MPKGKKQWLPLRRVVLTQEQKDRFQSNDEVEVWQNEHYHVVVRPWRNPYGIGYVLSIANRDKSTYRSWSDFQRIKNELCGDECDGMELYPAESRKFDNANRYWMWVYPAGVVVPRGSEDKMMGAASAVDAENMEEANE